METNPTLTELKAGKEHYLEDVRSVAPELEARKKLYLENPDNAVYKKWYEDLRDYSERASRLAHAEDLKLKAYFSGEQRGAEAERARILALIEFEIEYYDCRGWLNREDDIVIPVLKKLAEDIKSGKK